MKDAKITNVFLVSFSQIGTLKNHIYIVHEGHKDHRCEYCGKAFSQTGNLKKHIRSVHEGAKFRYLFYGFL